jgi:hypothetical protein
MGAPALPTPAPGVTVSQQPQTWTGLSAFRLFRYSIDLAAFWFCRYTLFMDPTENTYSCSCDIAQWHSHQGTLHRKHCFLQFFYRYMNNCCYADVAFHILLLLHSLLCCNLVTDVSSGWTSSFQCTWRTAPSLRLLVPSSLQANNHFFFSSLCGQNFWEWLVLLHPWILSC